MVLYSFKNLLQVFLGEEDVMTHEITMRREKNNSQNKNNTTRTRTYHRVFHRSKRPGFDKLCSIPLHFIIIVFLLCNKLQEREKEREREKREKRVKKSFKQRRKKAVKKNSQKGKRKREKNRSREKARAFLTTNNKQQHLWCFLFFIHSVLTALFALRFEYLTSRRRRRRWHHHGNNNRTILGRRCRNNSRSWLQRSRKKIPEL